MSYKIVYPKPLPELDKQNLPLETGFTSTEIAALQNGWRLIKRFLNQHSEEIFINFFSENYLQLDRFRVEDTHTFNLSSLHQHPYQLMNVYGNLIESGLKDVAYVKALLSALVSRHQVFDIDYEDVKLITDYITNYFINILVKIISPTFVNGLLKLSDLINEYHKGKTNEGEELSKKSVDMV